MGEYCYEFIKRQSPKAKNLEELYDLIFKDEKALSELKAIRNIDSKDEIIREIELIVDSYPELKKKYEV